MKYIISESRLENLAFKYLDTILEPHDIITVQALRRGTLYLWVVNEKVVAEIYHVIEDDNTLTVDFTIDEPIFNTIKDIFSITKNEVFDFVKKYLDLYHDLDVNVLIGHMSLNQFRYEHYRRKNV